MSVLLTIIGKDLRLLWRDRAALIFLTLAPVMVICVAGFSLANLYGADPTGQTAYELAFVDEDGGELARKIRARLEEERAIQLKPVAERGEAEEMVRRKKLGTALVIPEGTEAALAGGTPAKVILYTDSVKYLERLNMMTRLLEMRDALGGEQRGRLGEDAAAERARLEEEIERVRSAAADAQKRLESAWDKARRAREQASAQIRERLQRARRETESRLREQLGASASSASSAVDAQVDSLRTSLRAYFDSLKAAQRQFDAWLAELERLAGRHASDIPPPPTLPPVPESLQRLLDGGGSPIRLPTPSLRVALPAIAAPELPPLPELPVIDLPKIEVPAAPPLPASLAIEEINASGGPLSINTFDQNVPGFSVTFMLLGLLMGVSLGLLDERDWGTFERLRAMPVSTFHVLLGKLTSRFVVGVLQMLVLFAMGWLAFDVSLGPEPWALLLPIVAIVFAGTAFGLVVAAIAPSREAVLPVGSIVIVTMAAVGGCWWPIDLEPRWMRSVALAFPTTWAMDAFNDLMIRRRTLEVALLPTAVMLAYGLLYLALGTLLFRRRISTRR